MKTQKTMYKYFVHKLPSERESVRKFSKKKKYSSLSGILKSYKMDKTIYFESTLERDFATLLEFEDSVKKYLDHPFTIECKINGRKYSYTPDFEIEFNVNAVGNSFFLGELIMNRKMVVEIKYSDKIATFKDSYKKKLEGMREYCESNNLRFEIVNESFRDDYYKNVEKLLSFNNIPTHRETEYQIIDYLNKNPMSTFYSTIEALKESGIKNPNPSIWGMLGKKEIFCEMDKLINYNTKLWV